MTLADFADRSPVPACLAAYDRGVTEEPVADSAREVRRILVAALLAVLVAAPVATVLVLRGTGDAGVQPVSEAHLFASTYREPGFVEKTVDLVDDTDAPAATTRLHHGFGGTGTAWLVARCDTGSITVQAGALSSSRQCTGKPVGVAALGATAASDGSLDVVATVSGPQQSRWGVAVYR
jgi:hypothetical protein